MTLTQCFDHAMAATPEWSNKAYDYLIVDQDLKTVLSEFGKNVGIRTSVSADVQGRVHGNVSRTSSSSFLEALSRSYGLDWYYDGFTLFVTTMAEAQTRILDLRDVPFEAVAAGMTQAGLDDARYKLRPGPSPSSAIVSGPPRFVELVATSVAVLTAKRSSPSMVRVFRGGTSVEKVTFPAEGREGDADPSRSSAVASR